MNRLIFLMRFVDIKLRRNASRLQYNQKFACSHPIRNAQAFVYEEVVKLVVLLPFDPLVLPTSVELLSVESTLLDRQRF